MIKSLVGSVTFTVPAITLQVDFQPLTGITAVVGPNGSGKSFAAVELCRYLLFGKAALRGAASDYKTLEARGVFTIKGQDYRIERTPKGENITYLTDMSEVPADVPLAVGAKAVTEKVQQLLGYGLAVFDIANASVQKDADSFGKMAPADRKRLIDRVIGMSELEQIEKACRDEARGLRRDAETIERMLPTVPVVTGSFTRFSDDIARDLEHAEAYEALSRAVSFVQRPQRPSGYLPTSEAVESLQRHQIERQVVARKRSELDSVLTQARIYKPGMTEDQLVVAEERLRLRQIIADRGCPPTLTREQSEKEWAGWAVFDAHQPSDLVTCPNCAHEFHQTGEPPAQPSRTKAWLREDDAKRAKHVAPEPKLPAGPDLTKTEIRDHRAHNKADEEHAEAQTALTQLPDLKDLSAELDEARAAQAEWAAYSVGMAAADKADEKNAEVRDKLDALGEPREPASQLREQLIQAKEFETQWKAYDQAVIKRAELTAQITEASRMAEQFAAGAVAISEARTEIKAYLAPAISTAASKLINDMTHGKLSSVYVDEDMEITVNGQRIETLSGGGETVANIALRIALGQVLVKDTFPVFIGDEMDADADDERREAVIESLVSLKEHLDQIIIVTHRGIEVADHVFDMKNSQ